MTRVAVNPEMLRWARSRSRLEAADLAIRFPKLDEWEREERQPTLKQLENYARVTMTPIGFMFLPEPPVEKIPIPDFRTMRDHAMERPSPNLLDTIYLCQRRQTWYREHAQLSGMSPISFVASATLLSSIEVVANQIREVLEFDIDARRDAANWEDALRQFIAQADGIGVMVMCSGVVLNNNHRRLDPEEFRGFAMVDAIAPLVFINGADSKSAQMFTLAHELAHLWLGQSALSNSDAVGNDARAEERWCNQVAAELLVPLRSMRDQLRSNETLETAKQKRGRGRYFSSVRKRIDHGPFFSEIHIRTP